MEQGGLLADDGFRLITVISLEIVGNWKLFLSISPHNLNLTVLSSNLFSPRTSPVKHSLKMFYGLCSNCGCSTVPKEQLRGGAGRTYDNLYGTLVSSINSHKSSPNDVSTDVLCPPPPPVILITILSSSLKHISTHTTRRPGGE